MRIKIFELSSYYYLGSAGGPDDRKGELEKARI